MNKITLNERDLRVLAAIQLQADLTVPQISKLTNLPGHVVNHSLGKLIAEKVFQWCPFIDLYALGFVWCGVFFSVGAKQRQREAMLKFLASHSKVGWLAELSGQYHYGMAIAVKHVSEASEVLEELVQKLDILITKKSINFRLTLTDLPRLYLSKQRSEVAELASTKTSGTFVVDETNHKILMALSQPNFKSYRQAAQSSAIPVATFDLRLKALRTQNVFKGVAAEIDSSRLGRSSFKLLISTRGQRADFKKQLLSYARKAGNVVHMVESLGEWDYELNLEVETTGQLILQIEDLQQQFSEHITAVESLNILQVHKVNRYPFQLNR